MRALRIGLFLGWRQIQHASLWSTSLIVTIIVFTFLNLVLLSGILMGIVEGATHDVRTQALGDVNIVPIEGETRIMETTRFLQLLDTYHEIDSYSARYTGFASIEANYTERQRLSDESDVVSVNITGIDPVAEDMTTNLSELVVEGEYLNPEESGYIMLGKYNIDRYADEFGNVFDSLKNIYPGSTVKVTVDGQTREFIVKGIIDSKVDYVAISVYIPELEFRRLFNRADYNANQITVKIFPEYDEVTVRDRLRASDLSTVAEINSFTEDIPKFVVDVRRTFKSLSLIIGAIGITVASITIFIVIFINALSRRRQIGILKAIGITHRTIECTYIVQALFYVLIGSLIGMAITHFGLVPYFLQNPIDFPFANTSLSITTEGMFLRMFALIVVACVAGYVPARMIAKQNTLDAILGRK